MKIQESAENYLETILMLKEEKGTCLLYTSIPCGGDDDDRQQHGGHQRR